MKPWIAFFSQTGSEINAISKRIGRYPTLCICNTGDISRINKELWNNAAMFLYSQKNQKIPAAEYESHLNWYREKDPVITLNGWLRVVPESICSTYKIWNGHPGLITKYPQLKGKDPQQKAIDLKLETSGSVIHRVSAEVDAGEIVKHQEISIKDLTDYEVFSKLHETSVNLWVEFLKEQLK